jgi:hypothetical protein
MLGSREKRWQQILSFIGFEIFLPPQDRYLNFDLVIDQTSNTLDKPLTSEISYSLICQNYLRQFLMNLVQKDFPVINGVKNCVCILVKVQYQF